MKSLADALKNKSNELAAMGLEVKEQSRIDQWQPDPQRVPMMYRAQVLGRCSLHNASKKNPDLNIWTEEWTYPANGEARYQLTRPSLGEQGTFYRIEVEFPFRLFSNCGQDSIARPSIGKDGIPLLPGSSVKGLFLRACTPEQAIKYCGRQIRQQGKMQHLPSAIGFRFHRAYPVGNWANRIVDLVHPQGNRQIGTQGNPREEGTSASALISLYQPHLVFEFSCSDPQINWREVELLLLKAIQLGVGGKTSSGYGMGGYFPGKPPITPATPLSFLLKGVGVSSLLRDGTPEFRFNIFKASLRGHMRRLLGGVAIRDVDAVVNRWFGDTKAPSSVQLIWQNRREPTFTDTNQSDRNPSYSVEGLLYIDMGRRKPSSEAENKRIKEQEQKDIALLEKIVQFAYVMGGFGKSWRRIWHETFMSDYHNEHFAIGCHWSSPDLDKIQTLIQLQHFLDKLYDQCCDYLDIRKQAAQSAKWREAWHPDRVAVYSQVVNQSQAINLFHDEIFKTTPAIGGRRPHDKHPKEFNPPQNTSSVWHRMLPIGNNHYLEIVTVFHANRVPWKREGIDQFDFFIERLKENGLVFTWGWDPTTK
jgi:CRISPR-associated protein Cmr6